MALQVIIGGNTGAAQVSTAALSIVQNDTHVREITHGFLSAWFGGDLERMDKSLDGYLQPLIERLFWEVFPDADDSDACSFFDSFETKELVWIVTVNDDVTDEAATAMLDALQYGVSTYIELMASRGRAIAYFADPANAVG